MQLRNLIKSYNVDGGLGVYCNAIVEFKVLVALLVLVPLLLLGYYKMCRKEGMYRRLESTIQCEQ